MSFIQFINESEDKEATFIIAVAKNLIGRIGATRSYEENDYLSLKGMEFKEPFLFDLILNIKRDPNPDSKFDSHFKGLPWEDLNFEKNGYMIDANTKMNKEELVVPKIEIHIILDPKKEPSCYGELYYKLIDILTHETNHLEQVGINRRYPNTQVSSQKNRKLAKKSNSYFLLPEEIESMVKGMHARSISEDRYLDEIFFEYLDPFVKTGYITRKEFEKTMREWITHAIESYPDAKFSSKSDPIINSL